MNRANQQALFQATNQGLLGIRQQEINYYLNLNLAFGTQAALIGGFTYGVFTQNQLNQENDYGEVFFDICWIMSAATIASAVHVIVNTMLLQVVGPGLALHGPVGSIVRATEGMKVEQKQIVNAFILMMMMFALSTIMSFWVVMNFESALGSTAVFIIAARQWYFYTERIYLRFYWDADKSAWDDRKEDDSGREPGNFHERSPPNVVERKGLMKPPTGKKRQQSSDTTTNTLANTDMGRFNQDSSKDTDMTNNGGKSRVNRFLSAVRKNTIGPKNKNKDKKSSPFVNGDFSGNTGTGGRLNSKGSNSSVQDLTPHSTGSSSGSNLSGKHSTSKSLKMEGYLAKSGYTSVDPKHEPWERRYFTLSKGGHIFYFKSRMEYKNNPKDAINIRPLMLFEYNVLIANTDETQRKLSTDYAGSTMGGDGGSESDEPGLTHRTSYNFFSGGSVTDSGSKYGSATSSVIQSPLLSKHRFEMTLVLKEDEGRNGSKRWLLRCDTEEELDLWIECMREVSPMSFV